MIITRLLEASDLNLTRFSSTPVTQRYNSRAFGSMSYVQEEDCWIKKEVEASTTQPEADPPVEPVSLSDDMLGRVTAVDHKLDGLRELLLSQPDLLVKVKSITQKIGIDVAKFRMLLEKTSKDVLKTLKHVFSALDSVEIKFDALQTTIHETFEYFKNIVVATLLRTF
ncbi:hypothetical protein K7X08_014824 [Anisodus acutangulus]|uniref:Uncharacterized protein n=1 Tax=Anisodus acutangulus TaxID=402998 RepID=A0A9Q1R1K9_9SOLA|nr:hypothetical protein K7X08_014824 [Anisodus acutangulus]